MPYVNLVGDPAKLHQLRADLSGQSIKDIPPFPDMGGNDIPPRVFIPMPVEQARQKLENLGFVMTLMPVQRANGENEEWFAAPKCDLKPTPKFVRLTI